MCLFSWRDAVEKVLSSGRSCFVRGYKLVKYRDGGLYSPYHTYHSWEPGLIVSDSRKRKPHRSLTASIDNGIHVFLTKESARKKQNERRNGWLHRGEITVILPVTGQKDDLLGVNSDKQEAAFTKVMVNLRDFQNALRRAKRAYQNKRRAYPCAPTA